MIEQISTSIFLCSIVLVLSGMAWFRYARLRVSRPFLRFPYLEELTVTGVTISWITRKSTTGALRISSVGADDLYFESRRLGRHHSFRIDGLHPDTVHSYQVIVNAKIAVDNVYFKTIPLHGSECRIFVLADSGSGRRPQYRVAARIEEYLDQDKVDFGLHLGDISYSQTSTPDEDREYFRPYRRILCRVPIWLALGNHDVDYGKTVNHLAFHRMPGNKRWYSFDYGDVHMTILDSTRWNSTSQREWLERDLRDHQDARWKIVVLHHPPYCRPYIREGVLQSGSHTDIRNFWCPLFEQYGVDLVLSGHSHTYQRTRRIRDYSPGAKGIVYVVAGGGGERIDTIAEEIDTPGLMEAWLGGRYHFVRLKITNEQLAIMAVDDRGRVFDEFSLDRPST